MRGLLASPTDAPAWPRLLAAAGMFAAAELALALSIGGFFALGRAEPLLFFAFRPWLLLALALFVAGHEWRRRALAYCGALLLASAGEAGFLLALGAAEPFPAMVRGLVGGAMLALILDLLVQLAIRLLGSKGRLAGAVAGLALLLAPGGLALYDRILLDPPQEARARPELMLMTALPIIWGEGGAFDPDSRPAESYRLLEREFRIRPLDALSDASLSGRLLLLAQPRALAPEELVALDGWVRRGGRVLILADPALDWPSGLPLGDPRRPPPSSYLGPLFAHWGLWLEPRPEPGNVAEPLYGEQSDRRLISAKAGRFVATRSDCQVWLPSTIARCSIGKGRAWLVADADLLRDDLWAPHGPARHQRTADNPLIVAEWLDRLAGVDRDRLDGRVDWLDPEAPRALALLLGILPAGLAILPAAGVARPRRR